MMTHLSLFSGIGGLDLAAEMAGFRTVGQCEWADYPHAVLERHWPDVPKWRDIRTLTGESFYERTGLRTVDVVSGGFPCQPFSVAGKRRGKEDDRYLWPEMLRVVQDLRPTWVVGENVAGIVNLALDQVLSDLESIGYSVQAFIIPACAVNAAHRRDRCAIVANYNKVRCDMRGSERQGVHGDAPCHETDPGSEDVAYAESAECERKRRKAWKRRPEPGCCGWWPTEPDVGRVVNGVPSWMDRYWVEEPDIPRITTSKNNWVNRLRCLGNAVYWRQFYPVFESIREIEEGMA